MANAASVPKSSSSCVSAPMGWTQLLSESIQTELWEKAAFICAHAGMTATARLPLGDIRDQQESWEMYRRIIEEVCRVGRATGIELPEGTVGEWMEFADDLEGDSYSSLHWRYDPWQDDGTRSTPRYDCPRGVERTMLQCR